VVELSKVSSLILIQAISVSCGLLVGDLISTRSLWRPRIEIKKVASHQFIIKDILAKSCGGE